MKLPATTVAEFTHPETSSRVALVGNRHFGTPNYMEELQNRLIAYRLGGAAIHYEGVKKPTETEISNFSRRQMRNYQALKSLTNLGDRVHTDSRFSSIRTIISSRDWEHHDASMTDLVQRANLRQSLALGVVALVAKVVEWADEDGSFYKTTYEKMYTENESGAEDTKAQDPHENDPGILKMLYPLIVDYRNEVALNAVDTALAERPEQNLALLWGNGHVPGLSDGLVNRGFRQTSLELLDPLM